MRSEKIVEGWGIPAHKSYGCYQYHYFKEGQSLCDGYAQGGPLTKDDGKVQLEDCLVCHKVLKKEAGDE